MLKHWKKIICAVSIILIAFSFSACKKEEKKGGPKKEIISTVHMKSKNTSLFYTGTLQPIRTLSVFSPVDGRVHKIYFKYGDAVKKGQKLIALSSEKLVDSYRQAVSDYLTKKATYINGIQTYQGNIALHDAGVISDSTFINDKNTYETNLLSFYQSRYALEKILKEAGMDPSKVEALSLNDTRRLHKIFDKHFKNILIDSTGAGVALFPIQQGDSSSSSSSGSTDGTKLIVGANVNQNQLLLSIGDLGGLSVQLTVSEIDINRIKVGLPATITGDGFPGISLSGKVTQVSSQANPGDSGGDSGLSMFTVIVKVPKIDKKQRKVIRVGMTSKVQVEIRNPPQIHIPISAVHRNKGQTQVQVIKNGKPEWVNVLTGSTGMSNIRIVTGLKEGDRIVVQQGPADVSAPAPASKNGSKKTDTKKSDTKKADTKKKVTTAPASDKKQ